MPHLGPVEVFIILGIVLVLFGGGRVAKLGSEMGSAIKNFRQESQETPKESPTRQS